MSAGIASEDRDMPMESAENHALRTDVIPTSAAALGASDVGTSVPAPAAAVPAPAVAGLRVSAGPRARVRNLLVLPARKLHYTKLDDRAFNEKSMPSPSGAADAFCAGFMAALGRGLSVVLVGDGPHRVPVSIPGIECFRWLIALFFVLLL